MTTPIFVMLLIAAVIVLVGLAGVILLIVGLVKRWTALWVCGIVAMVLAGLALLVGVPAGLLVCLGVARSVTVHETAVHEAAVAEMAVAPDAGSSEGGNYVRQGDGRAAAHVEGVEI